MLEDNGQGGYIYVQDSATATEEMSRYNDLINAYSDLLTANS